MKLITSYLAPPSKILLVHLFFVFSRLDSISSYLEHLYSRCDHHLRPQLHPVPTLFKSLEWLLVAFISEQRTSQCFDSGLFFNLWPCEERPDWNYSESLTKGRCLSIASLVLAPNLRFRDPRKRKAINISQCFDLFLQIFINSW